MPQKTTKAGVSFSNSTKLAMNLAVSFLASDNLCRDRSIWWSELLLPNGAIPAAAQCFAPS